MLGSYIRKQCLVNNRIWRLTKFEDEESTELEIMFGVSPKTECTDSTALEVK
jgi:hypothetical protein